jgi:hypothetical protein
MATKQALLKLLLEILATEEEDTYSNKNMGKTKSH